MTDLTAMSLRLAEAKKDGEYILPSEVRVECAFGDGSYYGQQGAYPMYTKAGTHGDPAADNTCDCDGRGYTALDPEKLGRWQYYLAQAGYKKTGVTYDQARPVGMEWYGYTENRDGYYGTPEPAWFLSAMRALGVDTGVGVK